MVKRERSRYLSIYEQVARDLRDAIESGAYKPGGRLPRETDLARELGVAKKTLRHALAILEHEGLVIRRRSAGTFVAPEEMHRSRSEASIALLIPGPGAGTTDAVNLFGSAPLEIGEAVRYAAEKGIFFRIFPCPEGKSGGELAAGRVVAELKRKGFNGVIFFSPMRTQAVVRQLAFARFPHVALDSHVSEKGVHTVMWDDESAARECVRLLIKLGHRKIGFIGGVLKSPEINSGSRRRFAGYRKALDEAGVQFNERFVANIESLPSESISASYIPLARQLLKTKPRPTAVVSAVYGVASALWQEARAQGVGIPDDLSLVCVDVHPGNETEWLVRDKRFELSGFVKPMRKIGQVAVDRLLEWIKNGRDFEPRQVLIPFVWKEGSTAGLCRDKNANLSE